MAKGMNLEDIFWNGFTQDEDRDIFKVIEAGLLVVALKKPDELKKRRCRLVSLMNHKPYLSGKNDSKRIKAVTAASNANNGGTQTNNSQSDHLHRVSADKNDVERSKAVRRHVPKSCFDRQSNMELDRQATHSDAAKSVGARPSESKPISAKHSGIAKSVCAGPTKSILVSAASSDTRKGTKPVSDVSTLSLEAKFEAGAKRYRAKAEEIRNARRKVQVIDLKDIPCNNQLKRKRV